MNIGKFRIFRSIRQTLAENMSRWFVSTASPARAALPFVMDTVYGYKLPKKMQREFADVIQYISEQEGGEVEPQKMMEAFKKEYLENKMPFELVFVDIDDNMANDETHVSLDFKYNGKAIHSEADGNGPIDAVKLAVKQCVPQVDFSVLDYSEHSLGKGSGAKAAAYIEMRDNRAGILPLAWALVQTLREHPYAVCSLL